MWTMKWKPCLEVKKKENFLKSYIFFHVVSQSHWHLCWVGLQVQQNALLTTPKNDPDAQQSWEFPPERAVKHCFSAWC